MTRASVSLELLQRIAEAIASLQYGTVHVTVHDAHVVQIEKVERVRVAPDADLTPGRHAPSSPAHRTPGGPRLNRGRE